MDSGRLFFSDEKLRNDPLSSYLSLIGPNLERVCFLFFSMDVFLIGLDWIDIGTPPLIATLLSFQKQDAI